MAWVEFEVDLDSLAMQFSEELNQSSLIKFIRGRSVHGEADSAAPGVS